MHSSRIINFAIFYSLGDSATQHMLARSQPVAGCRAKWRMAGRAEKSMGVIEVARSQSLRQRFMGRELSVPQQQRSRTHLEVSIARIPPHRRAHGMLREFPDLRNCVPSQRALALDRAVPGTEPGGAAVSSLGQARAEPGGAAVSSLGQAKADTSLSAIAPCRIKF